MLEFPSFDDFLSECKADGVKSVRKFSATRPIDDYFWEVASVYSALVPVIDDKQNVVEHVVYRFAPDPIKNDKPIVSEEDAKAFDAAVEGKAKELDDRIAAEGIEVKGGMWS